MTARRTWLLWGGVLAAVTAVLIAVRGHIDAVYVAMAYLLVVQGSSAHGGGRRHRVLGEFLCRSRAREGRGRP